MGSILRYVSANVKETVKMSRIFDCTRKRKMQKIEGNHITCVCTWMCFHAYEHVYVYIWFTEYIEYMLILRF